MKTKFKITNRLLSFVLVLVMVLGMMPMMSMTAYAAASATSGLYTLTLDKETFSRYTSNIAGVKDVTVVTQSNNTLKVSFKYRTGSKWTGTYSVTVSNQDCTKDLSVNVTYHTGQNTSKEHKITGTLTRPAQASHTGGTANCTNGAACEVCGTIYGSPNNTHNWGEWTTENGTHSRTCTLNSSHKESGTCSGGTATCDSAPICSTCGKEYDSKLGHSYQYSANGNVITETCKNNCGHSETAKLEYATGNGTYSYTGLPIQPLKVNYSSGWQGETLDISYSVNNINVGTAKGVITIAQNGVKAEQTFTITEADISGATVTLDPASGEYTGNAYTPSVTVTLDGFGTLVKDTDYTVSWDKDGFTNADSYTATITGKGNFVGTQTAAFHIEPAEINGVVVTLDQNTFVYDGTAHKPNVTVTFNGETLTEGVDYELYYMSEDNVRHMESGEPIKFFGKTQSDSKDAGQYYAVVYGKGNFADNGKFAYAKYVINKATVNEPTIASKEYNGETQTADIESTDLYAVTENNGGKDAGKYNVVLTLTDSKNYRWKTTENADVTLDFEITKATNKWMPEPTISGWTYGETASTPNGAAKFGTVKVVYTGKANDGSDYNSETAPTKAGSYKATFTVTGNDNYTGLEKAVNFEIAKATYDMRDAKWDYTTAFNYDGTEKTVTVTGLPDGVKVVGYSENKEKVVGNYTAKVTLSYDGNNYNVPVVVDLTWSIINTWQPTEYTVTELNAGGWINGDFEITAADGYKVSTTNTADGVWADKLTYTAETDNGEVAFYLRKANGEISLAKTVNYKLDTTDPTGTVEFVGREPWQEFVNTITFGLFFKEEVTVKITANDTLSDIASIEYYEADELMTLDEVKAITNWTAYNDSFGVSVEDTKKFIYFVRIIDNAGNVSYLSTNGAEYDTTAPVISGVENGKTYYTTQKVTVTDKNIESITLNGATAGADITLDGDKEATYIIVATDKAGNITEYVVTMKTIAELTKSLDDITVGDVTSDDKEIIEQVIGDIDEQLANDDLTEDEKAALEETKDKAQDLLDKIDEAANADNTDNTEKVKDITADNVTPEDKTDLENAKTDLEKALEDHGGNYTDDEKKAIEDEIKKIDEALAVVTNAEGAEGKINALPDTITKNDEDAVKAAQEAYNALTDYEKSLVGAESKKALDDAVAALAALNKPADNTSPNTGDNSHMMLWFVLLFISGAVITLTVYDRKRRIAK